MARRLVYSQGGFERALMMVRVAVVGIVEGHYDVHFYEILLGQYLNERGMEGGSQIRTPREVESGADGKKALINIFKRARRRGRLQVSTDSSKSLIFFTDRDYDDYSRSALRNPHVIYTPGVTMENAAYEAGRLHQCIEAIIGRRIAAGTLLATSDFNAWKVRCAKSWRDWLVYCLMCEISSVAPRKNRSGPSPVHFGDPPALKVEEFENLVEELTVKLGDRPAAEKLFRRASRAVDKALSPAQVDKIFCGKWFPYFLKADIQRLGTPYVMNASKINKSGALLSHLLTDFKFHGRVKDYYYNKLDKVLA